MTKWQLNCRTGIPRRDYFKMINVSHNSGFHLRNRNKVIESYRLGINKILIPQNI